MPLRTILVYGNGQAEAVAAVLGRTPHVSELARIEYLSSSDYFGACERLSNGLNCAVFCEQYYPQAFPCRERLAKTCFKLKFPAVDLNLLWPFYCVNPHDAAEPGLPHGRFPYGDRIIVDAVDKGLAPDDILDYYIGGWSDYQIDLDQFRLLETNRMAERESQCDIKMSAYLLQHLATRRFFWTVDHPTAALLEELIERIMIACGRIEPTLLDADFSRTVEAHIRSQGDVGQMRIPIHPKVAEHFELEWYDPNEKFHGPDGTMYSYSEYFSAMIRHSYAVKEQRP